MTDDKVVEKTVTKKKLFGVQNPVGKFILYIAFVILTGGFGLILLLFALIGDRALAKRRKKSTKEEDRGYDELV